MQAVTIRDKVLSVGEHPDPVAGVGEVLVAVRAAGLNGADMMQRMGHYPAPPGSPAEIPGLEFAGEVKECGAGSERFAVGDRVMGIVGGGGQAELVAVHERQLMPVPEALDWAQAGGVPEVFLTAHDALFTQAQLRCGERLLVHGGAGGVGTAAIQLGRLVGAEVFATVRDESLRAGVSDLGATVLDPNDFADHGPFDVVLELVGAVNLPANIQSLDVGGRIVVIGVGAGTKSEINLLALMAKRARIHGSMLRARPLEEKAIASRRVEQEVLPAMQTGALKVPIYETFALSDAVAAYDKFAAGGKLGKIVLIMTDGD